MSNKSVARWIAEEAEDMQQGRVDPYDIASVRSHLGPIGVVGFGADGTDRWPLFLAWEQKYGRFPTRTEQAWLTKARPADIINRMQSLGKREPKFAGEAAFAGDMMSDKQAVETVRKAFRDVHGRDGNAAEIEAETSVGRHEGSYGSGWARACKGAGVGSNNWGAIQSHKYEEGVDHSADSFLCVDSRPDPKGGPNIEYKVWFWKEPTPEKGAARLVKTIGKRPLQFLADNGNSITAFALGMYHNRYFEEVNLTPKQKADYAEIISAVNKLGLPTAARAGDSDVLRAGRVAAYAFKLNRNADIIAKSTGKARATTLLPAGTGKKAGLVAGAVAVLAALGAGTYVATRRHRAA